MPLAGAFAVCGLKLAVRGQVELGRTFAQLLDTVKSVVVVAMLETVRVAVPVLVSVTDCEALVLPTIVLPKVSEFCESVIAAINAVFEGEEL